MFVQERGWLLLHRDLDTWLLLDRDLDTWLLLHGDLETDKILLLVEMILNCLQW